MRWLTWNGLNNRIMFGEIIVPYIIGGSLFGLLFELLVNKMSDEDREPTEEEIEAEEAASKNESLQFKNTWSYIRC